MGLKSTLRLMRTLGPSLASLAQSTWSLLSNALVGVGLHQKTLNIFIDKSHIYMSLVAFQKLLKRCDFSEYFTKILSLVIDYNVLIIDYTVMF